MKATTLAQIERIARPLVTRLAPRTVVSRYSRGRLDFLEKLKEEIPLESYMPPDRLSRKLWGMRFLSPIMNAAGMFKNGECYEIVSRQGAGAYLGGTGTFNPREGNRWKNQKYEIYLPFVPYRRTSAASNWLGLPNDGDVINSERARCFERSIVPVGWSVMGSPDFNGEEKLRYLVEGMRLYEKAGVAFLEINESCPNTRYGKPQDEDLADRLRYVKEHFLDQRSRRIPVIIKFSNDTDLSQIPQILDMLFELGFDGVNFGNTSTAYSKLREYIDPKERRLFDYFVKTFGGGVSGRPLRELSLKLAGRATEYTRAGPPSQEFHVIRTGGIETINDIIESEKAGISLNQWYTGYYENFSKFGHDVYRKLFE